MDVPTSAAPPPHVRVPPARREEKSRAHVVLPELPGAALARAVGVAALLVVPQLHPADLARDRLGELRELEPPDPLVGSEMLARVRQDLTGGLGSRLPSGR